MSKKQAVVGERFDYLLDFENNTPLDLSSVGIVDVLDPRLALDEKHVQVVCRSKTSLVWKNRQLQVLIPKGVKRREHVQVIIPVAVLASPSVK